MKLGFYDDFNPCVITEDGVVDISVVVRGLQAGSPQLTMENIIVNYQFLKPKIEEHLDEASVLSLEDVRLRPPVPRPGKVLCGRGNFMEGVPVDPTRPLATFFKSPDAVIGRGDTIVLPSF